MEPRTDVIGYIDPILAWTIRLERRTALANVYRLMTPLVENETREEFLRIAYNDMWTYCRDEGYACEEAAQAFLGKAVQLDSGLLKAVLHQLLCRLLMQAACMPRCIKPCCCNCAAAPDDIECAKRIFAV